MQEVQGVHATRLVYRSRMGEMATFHGVSVPIEHASCAANANAAAATVLDMCKFELELQVSVW
jgi:hypothetical protein